MESDTEDESMTLDDESDYDGDDEDQKFKNCILFFFLNIYKSVF